MKSNNPIFRNSEEFNRAPATGYSDPSTWGTGAPGQPGQPGLYDERRRDTKPMSIDSVVQSTAISLGVVIVTALATWILTPAVSVSETGAAQISGSLIAAVTIGSLGAFALSMVNSFKRVISPALVIAFAALEGVALGGLSKLFDMQFGGGVVSGAVIGTFAAFAGTLAAYKVFDIKVGRKFQMFVMAGVFGMVGLSLMELVLGLFNAQLGLFGFGTLGFLTAVIGLALGVFMLVMDFDFVEQGVRNGLPERESWRAAFAMTVSLVWIYTNLLRLLAILNRN